MSFLDFEHPERQCTFSEKHKLQAVLDHRDAIAGLLAERALALSFECTFHDGEHFVNPLSQCSSCRLNVCTYDTEDSSSRSEPWLYLHWEPTGLGLR